MRQHSRGEVGPPGSRPAGENGSCEAVENVSGFFDPNLRNDTEKFLGAFRFAFSGDK